MRLLTLTFTLHFRPTHACTASRWTGCFPRINTYIYHYIIINAFLSLRNTIQKGAPVANVSLEKLLLRTDCTLLDCSDEDTGSRSDPTNLWPSVVVSWATHGYKCWMFALPPSHLMMMSLLDHATGQEEALHIPQSPANKPPSNIHPSPSSYMGRLVSFKQPVGSIFQNISSTHVQNKYIA